MDRICLERCRRSNEGLSQLRPLGARELGVKRAKGHRDNNEGHNKNGRFPVASKPTTTEVDYYKTMLEEG